MRTIALLCALLAWEARADVVYFRSGGRLEGQVVDRGDQIEIRSGSSSMLVDKSKIERIEEAPTFEETLEKRRAELGEQDAEARVDLGRWCEEQDRPDEARQLYEEALIIDPDHALARIAFDELRAEHEAEERARAQRQREREQREAEREVLAQERAERLETRRLQRRVNSLFREIAYGAKTRSDRALGDVIDIAAELHWRELAVKAVEVQRRFDAYWQQVHEEQRTGLVEIRATRAQLTRPIRTFSTSLGTGSPVTLHLPERSVASVQTTVAIPLGRGR